MNIRFLGTGAADWTHPAPDGEYRRFASLLVDGWLLIDCTQSALDYMRELGIDAQSITDVLITHSHDDHFTEEALSQLAHGRDINVYIESGWAGEVNIPGANVIPIRAGEGFTIRDCSILPLRANHKGVRDNETALHYLIRQGDLTWYYATDGAWLTTHEFHALLRGQYHIDAWVSDATIGDGHDGDVRIFEHNSLSMLREMLKTLSATGVLKPGAPFILTHMARTLHPCQAELERSLQPPFIAAYDGMRMELEPVQ